MAVKLDSALCLCEKSNFLSWAIRTVFVDPVTNFFSLTNSPAHPHTHPPTHTPIHPLTHSLTTVASLEPKRSSALSPFYATTTNSPVGCAFWVPTSVRPVRLVFSFIFNQASSSSDETISRHKFSISTLSLSSIIDATKLFKALRLSYSTKVPVPR